MTELRKKTEGATEPGADHREYVVGVELLASPADEHPPGKRIGCPQEDEPAKTKPEPEKKRKRKTTRTRRRKGKARQAKAPGPLAVVTWYRYFDDITVFSTVDLGTGKVVAVEAVAASAHAAFRATNSKRPRSLLARRATR